MKVRNYAPAKCEACGRFTRTLCIACSTPLCDDHVDFPICSDCTIEHEREELIARAERDRDRALEEDR